jgi:adenylate cyclase
MSAESFKRKLTAILSADVKGYSRLMGENEAETVRTLTSYRKIMAELIQQHRGRVIDSPGDNILAEFGSVVDAVQCSVAAQNEFKARNAELPENRRMVFRIGVNLGDVIEEENRIYGDGVNIAARLESLADPGGICISKTAFDQIETKLPLGYEFLGEQEVKNIAKPVGAYRVLMDPRVTVAGSKDKKPSKPVWRKKGVLAAAMVVLIVLIVVEIWNFTWRAPKIEPASKEKMAYPLPDVPSIAVMPFVNMSEDPKQEFLCDGMTEEIITSLTKVPQLLVIGGNSIFTYKGKPVNVKQVSEELGVRYVLEGSLQRSGDRIRINAQLIDALTGNHLWAERYDRDLKDIFSLQDEITIKILTGLRVKLGQEAEVLRAQEYAKKDFKGKQELDCSLKRMEAIDYYNHWNIEDNNIARRMIEETIAMCPENPMGYLNLGWVYQHDYWLGNTKSPQETVEKGIELAQKALALDDSIAGPHALLSYLYVLKGEYDKAIAEGERAVALNPGATIFLDAYGTALRSADRPEEAIPLYQKAIRFNPLGPSYLYLNFGFALRATGRREEAVSAFKKAIQIAPNNFLAHIGLAATYSAMGREKEARAEADEVLRISPKFSVDSFAKIITNKNQSRVDELVNALRKAGLK